MLLGVYNFITNIMALFLGGGGTISDGVPKVRRIFNE